MIEKVVLGFGSNVGSRKKFIQSAVRILALSKELNLLGQSSLYETEPWGYQKQNRFLNSCAVFLCRLTPADLLKKVKLTEKKLGRVNRGKWKAREIDIDVLFYGSEVINKGKLVIPHPHIKERNFVLEPLNELMPEFIHPVFKKSIRYIYNHSKDRCNVHRMA